MPSPTCLFHQCFGQSYKPTCDCSEAFSVSSSDGRLFLLNMRVLHCMRSIGLLGMCQDGGTRSMVGLLFERFSLKPRWAPSNRDMLIIFVSLQTKVNREPSKRKTIPIQFGGFGPGKTPREKKGNTRWMCLPYCKKGTKETRNPWALVVGLFAIFETCSVIPPIGPSLRTFSPAFTRIPSTPSRKPERTLSMLFVP